MFNKNYFHNIYNLKFKSNTFFKGLTYFVFLVSLIVGCSLANSNLINVSAHARHYRIIRIYHHKKHSHRSYHYNHQKLEHKHHIKLSSIHNKRKSHHRINHNTYIRREKSERKVAINNDGNNSFARQEAFDIYKDINSTRLQNGLKSLPINTNIQRIANLRNQQVNYAYTHYDNYKNYTINHGESNPSDNWIHGYDTGQTADDDASKLKISDDNGTAENAGNIYVKGMTRYATCSKSYNVNTPADAAYANINNMTNDDALSNWGHRKNILDKDATGIGIASYYNPQTKYSTNVEDFSYGNNPKDI